MQKEAGIPKKIIDDIPGLSKYLFLNLSLMTWQYFCMVPVGKIMHYLSLKIACFVSIFFTSLLCFANLYDEMSTSCPRPYARYLTFLLLNFFIVSYICHSFCVVIVAYLGQFSCHIWCRKPVLCMKVLWAKGRELFSFIQFKIKYASLLTLKNKLCLPANPEIPGVRMGRFRRTHPLPLPFPQVFRTWILSLFLSVPSLPPIQYGLIDVSTGMLWKIWCILSLWVTWFIFVLFQFPD